MMQRFTCIATCRELRGLVKRSYVSSLASPLNRTYSTMAKQPLCRSLTSTYTCTAGPLGEPTAQCSLHNLWRQSVFFPHEKYRHYCTERENERKRTGGHGHHGITVVGIPDPLTWIRNKVHIYLIELYFQLGINSVEFDNGVKQALVHVSTMMSNGNFEELRGLVSTEMVVYAQQRCRALSETQRRHLAISLDDIIFILPEEVSIVFDSNGRKFCFIVIRFWHMSTADVPEDPESTKIFKMAATEEDGPQKKIVTAVYEFHRELTRGAEPDWTVTNIWHWHWKQIG
ncbi:m-AAA protease-interacting protein 1, mitochondrial [Salvelinus namaycush]|uniref:M-AAA protease-interacting protein 1, mitochondrial n=1 Tax=Salvelinus namaycush TaxID=8040 RepID=A0A8U0PX43_SALNM|nr:m-AAA protease-interacting protein 1, mitochondrial [Salvelinus namaycush]